jgi:DNA-binding XRE family transcriptional regulator
MSSVHKVSSMRQDGQEAEGPRLPAPRRRGRPLGGSQDVLQAPPQQHITVRDAAELGDAIKRRRVSLGLTQGAVAAMTGLPRSSLIRLESGRSGAPIWKVLDLLRDLGITITLGVPAMPGTPPPSHP